MGYDNGLIGVRWWLAGKENEYYPELEHEDPADRMLALIRHLRQKQYLRLRYDLLHARIYGNLRSAGFGINSHTQLDGITDDRITLNICKNMVNAVVAKITKNRPKATIITHGANRALKRRSKLLEHYIEGQFYRTNFRKRAVEAFRDACIFGTGFIKISRDNDEIMVDRIPPWMIEVDDGECVMGMPPRSIYQRMPVDRQMLIDVFARDNPELAEDIVKISTHLSEDGGLGRDTTADQIIVSEGWHLPSSPGANDGRHIIAINGSSAQKSSVKLLDEDWNYDHFPFIEIRWSEMPAGFFGVGLCAELTGLQTEINKLLRQIQQAHHLCGWPRIYVKRGSKVITAHINNEIGGIIEYDDVPPQQASFPVVPTEIYNHLQFLIKSAYEVSGISQMSATSQKPPGVESAIALMTLEDVQSDRFNEVGRAWEQLHCDGAERILEISRDIAADKPSYAINAVGNQELKTIPWSESVLEVEQYRLQVWPTSLLPSTPTGKLSFVDSLSKITSMDEDDLLDLIDIPDTESYRRRRRAARDLIERTLDKIVEEKIFISPEPYDDLNFCFKRAQERYNEERLNEEPEEEVLDLLRRYMLIANNLLNPPPPENPMEMETTGATPDIAGANPANQLANPLGTPGVPQAPSAPPPLPPSPMAA